MKTGLWPIGILGGLMDRKTDNCGQVGVEGAGKGSKHAWGMAEMGRGFERKRRGWVCDVTKSPCVVTKYTYPHASHRPVNVFLRPKDFVLYRDEPLKH